MGLLDTIRRRKEEAPPIDLKDVYDASIKDLPEPRFPSFDQALAQAIQDYTNPEHVRKNEIFQFEAARLREPDFYLPYFWIATYNMNNRNYPSAIEVLREGIVKANTKSILCRRLGECYLWVGDIEKAIYWLCTAIMAGDQKTDYHVYLFLGYIYAACGMKKASYWAIRRGRGISYQVTYMALEYIKPTSDRIKEVTLRHRTEKAERMLAAFYPFAKKKLGHL